MFACACGTTDEHGWSDAALRDGLAALESTAAASLWVVSKTPPCSEGAPGCQRIGGPCSPSPRPVTVQHSAEDGGADTPGDVLYTALAPTIRCLFIHSAAECMAADQPLLDTSLPAGEALTVYTLYNLFLLCGIKRHHCQRFVTGIIAQLLHKCFPDAAGAAATLSQHPHLASPLASESLRSSPVVPHPPSSLSESSGRDGKALQSGTGTMSACTALRPRWVDQESWKWARAHPLSLDEAVHVLAAAASSLDAVPREGGRTAVVGDPAASVVLCVPQQTMEKLISGLFVKELRGQMMTVHPIPRWRMACRLLNKKQAPVVLFCGGTSGSGKSTLAALLASQLSIGQVLSTDTVRQLLRTRVKKEDAPELFVSTYEAYKVRRDPTNPATDAASTTAPFELRQQQTSVSTAQDVLGAYETQARLVLDVLDKTLDNLIARGESVVVEGVHLLPEYMARKQRELWARHVLCSSVLVQIRKEARHRERFAVRVKCMTLDPKGNKYVSHFPQIRTIQSFLSTQAEPLPILSINNTNVDKSFMMVHHALLQLMEHVEREGWPGPEQSPISVRTPANVNAKKMLLYLREHRKEKQQQPRGRGTRAPQRPARQGMPRAAATPAVATVATCPHTASDGRAIGAGEPCPYCEALHHLTTSVATRAHSVEMLTPSERRYFDSGTPPYPPRKRCERQHLSGVSDDTEAVPTNVKSLDSLAAATQKEGDRDLRFGGGDPLVGGTTASHMDAIMGLLLPQRSHSYASGTTRRHRAPNAHCLNEKGATDNNHRHASPVEAATRTTSGLTAPGNSEDEEDETGSLLDERQ